MRVNAWQAWFIPLFFLNFLAQANYVHAAANRFMPLAAMTR
jgi:hypothetical protein